MTQFDTNQLVLEQQHTDTVSQPGNNGNDDHNNKIRAWLLPGMELVISS
jgi:hypothetical protein